MSSCGVISRSITSSGLFAGLEHECEPEDPTPAGYLHLGLTTAACAMLSGLGADFDRLAAEAGISPSLFARGGTLFPLASLGHLTMLDADRRQYAPFGFPIGQQDTLASLGLIGALMRVSNTVGDALRAFEVHVGALNQGAVVRLCIDGEFAELRYCPYGLGTSGVGLHSEAALVTATIALRTLCGSDWSPSEILLPRYAPHDTASHQRFFRAPVRFEQEVAALVFSARLLERRIDGADPAVRRRVERQVRQLEPTSRAGLGSELRRLLRTEVLGKRCSVRAVARHLSMNCRTLSRRLAAEGTSFKMLSAEIQFGIAKQLLSDTNMSLVQVSAALDFSEAAAFTHAFRRWSGTTPSAWRKAYRPTEMPAEKQSGKREPEAQRARQDTSRTSEPTDPIVADRKEHDDARYRASHAN